MRIRLFDSMIHKSIEDTVELRLYLQFSILFVTQQYLEMKAMKSSLASMHHTCCLPPRVKEGEESTIYAPTFMNLLLPVTS